MQLGLNQLSGHLQKPLASLYVVHGDEPLLTIEAADAIRAAARQQGFSEREVLISGASFRWDELTLASGNLSLFGDTKLIDLRIPNGKPGKEGGEALKHYCDGLREGDGVVTLISLPQLDWQTRKVSWFKALTDSGVVIECNAPPLAQLPDWIAGRLARQKQGAPKDGLEFIASHVEGNLLAAHQEIQKLSLLYPEGQLTLAQIEDAVLDVARFDTEKLRSALLAGDLARCCRLLDGLKAEDTAAPLVLWAMTTEIRTLGQLRSAIDKGVGLDAAMGMCKIFGPRQAIYRSAAQRIGSNTLRSALLHAARIDRMIKGLISGDLWDEFQQLALRLSSARRTNH